MGTRVLAGDIGGTKSLLAVFEAEGSSLRAVAERRFETRRFEGLGPMVRSFLAESPGTLSGAAFGVASPVLGDECHGVNMPWPIRRGALEEEIGTSVRLVNDFQGVGAGLTHLTPADLLVLQEGREEPGGPRALLGAGTGLGEAFLLSGQGPVAGGKGSRYRVHPSEGGHCDFAPHTPVEAGLLLFLAGRHGHVSWERVLSGAGLRAIYDYLVERGGAAPDPSTAAEMAREDPAAVVTRRALAGTDPACRQALDIFLSVYGAEAGNLALKVLASGGVYVAGGMILHMLPRLAEGAFLAAFRDKGRYSEFLHRVPVRVVTTPRVGLLGAGAVAAFGAA